MGTVVAFWAGILAAVGNLCMRRSIDDGGSARGYLVVQVSFSCLVAILLNPVRTGFFMPSPASVALGAVGGVVLGAMLWSMGRALEKGPPGLTFAVVNSATVMPAVVMAYFFGKALGHGYQWSHAVGSLLVVLGLFWAGWEARIPRKKLQWMSYVILSFGLHVLLLVFLQCRVLLFSESIGAQLPFSFAEETGQWFTPVLLLVAALFQLPTRGRPLTGPLNRHDWWWGLLGGVASGAATFLLILAPEVARPWENAMLFPVFAVTVIVASHTWGRTLYRERVNWLACAVCVLGLCLGSMMR